MSKKEILNTIKSLGQSQGFYGRLYDTLMSMTEAERDECLAEMQANCSDPVSLVMAIEG